MKFWETIENEIFRNDQLDVYEKMCLLVLMSREEEEIHLSSDELARYMGCGTITAKRAFDSLRLKGYFTKDYQKNPPKAREGSIIKGEEEVVEITKILEGAPEDFQEGFFTSSDFETGSETEVAKAPIDEEDERRRLLTEYLLAPTEDTAKPFVSKKESKKDLVDDVIDLFDEKISFKEANILLAFANNDVDRIKKQYKIAKQSQVSDTMGVLINALQRKESNIIKSSEEGVGEKSQIDANRLRKMQAYRNGGIK